MMKIAVILLSIALLHNVEARDPKFIFVSSSTSTSVSTTTSTISATRTCLLLQSTAYAACSGRKRRAEIYTKEGLIDSSDINISKSRNSMDIPELNPSKIESEQSNRNARFAWYYMTTTVTSVSTSTSTSTNFASSVSISALTCTPTVFLACGK
eukprot:TRINITY_DN724_c0_g2_i1.p1 TRINITY_DN724_c0_g2~~TRINITY_DN724_c0_g2_i1.p1  ORF type:complete len:154 (+),score=30.85 TRINITY_DN724_c0_g2_i1:31-492(+)